MITALENVLPVSEGTSPIVPIVRRCSSKQVSEALRLFWHPISGCISCKFYDQRRLKLQREPLLKLLLLELPRRQKVTPRPLI